MTPEPEPAPKVEPALPDPIERLYPFVLRARILMVGRETLQRSKPRLHFVLITEDLSEGSRREIVAVFAHYPVVQHYSSAQLEAFFRVRGAKVVGFQKSGLAQSIYAGLKQYRINPVHVAKSSPAAEPGQKPGPPTGGGPN